MAPFAKAFSHVSGNIKTYLGTRFSGFRRTAPIDASLEEEKELKVMARRVLPNGQPFSQTVTIDRMLMQFPSESAKSEVRTD
jgi:hypothetical protein